MRAGIHPEYTTSKIVCLCGNSIETRSTGAEEIHIEICSACHPFYTGQQKIVDTAGRVERFKRRYDAKSATKTESAKESVAAEKPAAVKKPAAPKKTAAAKKPAAAKKAESAKKK